MVPKTFIDVPPARASKARALGAVWDPDARSYFVPAGADLAVFTDWLPRESTASSSELSVAPVRETALAVPSKGIPLSQLLNGVASAVATAFKAGVWTTVEVANVNARSGHVYLELSERDREGRLVAKATGTIWASTANRILSEFERASGATLAPGIKLLVRARPTYKPQHGFTVDIDAIDPSYTLGDLEARKREIRTRLQQEGVFGAQKSLIAPWDFSAVLVIAPEGAAGLGDFQAESDRLVAHGVCQFVFATSRFQGEGAAAEIVQALRIALASWAGDVPPDAIAIIRGGGAVNDLAWLNDYDLARLICGLSVPVFTGIGHERDSTVLDEVSHTKFDTPSKVIAGIEQVIVKRTSEAGEFYETIIQVAELAAQKARAALQLFDAEVRAGAQRQTAFARRVSGDHFLAMKEESMASITAARAGALVGINAVRQGAAAAMANAKSASQASQTFVLERAGSQVGRAKAEADIAQELVIRGARQALVTAKQGAESLMREIAGQGPDKTLGRGFAIVRGAGGSPVTCAAAVGPSQEITVQFQDGLIEAQVSRESR